MNDRTLMEGASSISEKTVERYLCYEEKIKTTANLFYIRKTLPQLLIRRQYKFASAICSCLLFVCVILFALSSSGCFMLIDLSDIFSYEKIESITITGGALDSVHTTLKSEEDIRRFCEMFDKKQDRFWAVNSKISSELPTNKDQLEIFKGCCVLIKYSNSSENLMLIVNPDNSFAFHQGEKSYICNNLNALDCNKIKYFK